jgi:Skp family chaperone for outer membrane proteins
MKVFRFLTKISIFILMLSASGLAQTETPQNSAPNKIATINTDAFDDRTNGIKEVIEAYDKLEAEFKVERAQLNSLMEAIQDRQKGIEELAKVDFRIDYSREFLKEYDIKFKSKLEELELLQSKYKEKIDKARVLYENREAQTVEPIKKKISESAKLFAKEKGYVLILDGSKFKDGIILANPEHDDLTAEFIKYYNENFVKTKTQ